MLETRALFIGLREALGRWHLCGIHIGATRETCKQVMQVVHTLRIKRRFSKVIRIIKWD